MKGFSFLKKVLPFLAIGLITLWSCQKSIDDFGVSGDQIPDLTTKVNAAVSGFVTDENNTAMSGATVTVGTRTTTTDQYGYFVVKNVDVVKTAAVVTVSKPGYFHGIKTFIAAQGKSAFFRIKMIPKNNAGAINASSGGNVTLTNGMIVALPSNAVVNASTGVTYNGMVNVAAYWINPTSQYVNAEMPGDLRGLNTAGSIKALQSFGMVAVELTGASGELLQIASGQKATVTFPIPTSLTAIAPAEIPLWYFDEAIGLWKEEGVATKNGNNYVGEVSHFSFWNCDVPNNYVQFDCTILDADNTPIPFAVVKISDLSDPYNSRIGFTDSTGYVSGAVPDNANLKMEVFTYQACTSAAYAQNFTTTSVSISLGNIVIANTALNQSAVSGTVTDCNNNPVTSGSIIVLKDNQYFRYGINSNGTYNFSSLLCSGPTTVTLIATDAVTAQQSTPVTATFANGPVTIPNIQACGISTAQFMNYTINGTNYTYASPADSFYMVVNQQIVPSRIEISAEQFGLGQSGFGTIGFDATGVAVGSSQAVSLFYCSQISDTTSFVSPFNVNITEYGNIGEFIAGDFAGTINGMTTTYIVSGNFRVRRRQ
jgi:hypothetical protein